MSDNNDFWMLDDYYTTYIGSRLERQKDRDSTLSYSRSKEYDDLRVLFAVCRAKNIFTDEEREFLIELAPVAGKADRHCRLSVRVRFRDVNTCIITVKDAGFGEMFPTSNRIWEKTVRLFGQAENRRVNGGKNRDTL